MSGGLGRRYARALLALAQQAGAAPAVNDEIGGLAAAFQDPQLRAVLESPAINAATRRKVLTNVVAAIGVSKLVSNLVCLLADRGRLGVLPDVAQSYQQLLDRQLGRTRVRIVSAVPLDAAENTELVELAKRLTRSTETVITTEVDDALLGGVVLDASGTVYDGSVKTQLARLSKEMAGA